MDNDVSDFKVGELVRFRGMSSHWREWEGQLAVVTGFSPCGDFVRVKRLSDSKTGGWLPHLMEKPDAKS